MTNRFEVVIVPAKGERRVAREAEIVGPWTADVVRAVIESALEESSSAPERYAWRSLSRPQWAMVAFAIGGGVTFVTMEGLGEDVLNRVLDELDQEIKAGFPPWWIPSRESTKGERSRKGVQREGRES